MNEEVKEILEYLKKSTNSKDFCGMMITKNNLDKILDYITNLQNEKIELIKQRDNYKSRVENALGIAFEYAQIDGSHHKMWTIDQMVRELAEDYNNWIKKYEYDEETGEEYTWDTGINP